MADLADLGFVQDISIDVSWQPLAGGQPEQAAAIVNLSPVGARIRALNDSTVGPGDLVLVRAEHRGAVVRVERVEAGVNPATSHYVVRFVMFDNEIKQWIRSTSATAQWLFRQRSGAARVAEARRALPHIRPVPLRGRDAT